MELDMTKGKPMGLIFKFIIPVIAGNIIQLLYNTVDTLIVGRFVGVDALAAVGSTASIFWLITGFGGGLTSGFTILTSQRYGAHDREGMQRSIGNSVVLSLIVSLILTVLSVVFIGDILVMMNTPDEIMEMTKDYCVVICWGMVTSIMYGLLAGILRAVGNSKTPLLFLIISSITNAALDYILIVFGNMGVAGAALATVIAQALAAVLCMLYIIKAVPVLHVEWRHYKLDPQCVKFQLSIGLPTAIQASVAALGAIVVQSVLNMFGPVALSGMSVATKIEQIVMQIYGSLSITMRTYAAQNKGVNDLKRIKAGIRAADVLAIASGIAIYALTLLILPYAVRLFVTENAEQVTEYARIYLSISGVCYVPLGILFIYRAVLQGCGYGLAPLIGGGVELVSRSVVAYVAGYLMSFPLAAFAGVSSWVTTGVFYFVIYQIYIRKLQKRFGD